MSKFKVEVWASANLQGANWREIVDLVDDYNLSEEEADDYIKALEPDHKANLDHDATEIDLRECAYQMAGFEWGVSPTESEEK